MKKMKKINQKLSREELRLKMCELQDEANLYRLAIDAIDKKANEEKYKNLINKCFYHSNEYIRVECYDKNFLLYGTVVRYYGEQDFEDLELLRIFFNDTIFEDTIEKSVEISHSEFNEVLKKAENLIKYC